MSSDSIQSVTIGPCTLHLGDCLKIAPNLESVDAVVTDPPYEIVASGGGICATRKDLHETEGFTDCGFDYGILSGFKNWVVFGTLKQVPKLIEAAGDRRYMLVTWNKPNPCPLVNGNYLPDTEYIVHAWSRGGLHGSLADRRRFIVHPLGDKEDGSHPNEKPVAVVSKMVRLSSAVGWTVLDPFMGSGTTGVACIRTGRRFIGIEIDPRHFKTACDRIQREVDQFQLPLAPEPQPKQVDLIA